MGFTTSDIQKSEFSAKERSASSIFNSTFNITPTYSCVKMNSLTKWGMVKYRSIAKKFARNPILP